jgi:DNA-binding SARP family transcriptional activator
MRVEIDLLGGFSVRVDGRTIPAADWRRRQAAALVKLLALAPRHTLHREQVIDALWPDVGIDDAPPRLHKAAHYARRSLGDPRALVLDGNTVSLLPGADVVVDVDVFEQQAQQVLETADEDGNIDRSAAAATADLWTGDLLPDDLYDAWLNGPRDRLRQLHNEMLRRVGRWGDSRVLTLPMRKPAWRSRGDSPTMATVVAPCGSWSGWSEPSARNSV